MTSEKRARAQSSNTQWTKFKKKSVDREPISKKINKNEWLVCDMCVWCLCIKYHLGSCSMMIFFFWYGSSSSSSSDWKKNLGHCLSQQQSNRIMKYSPWFKRRKKWIKIKKNRPKLSNAKFFRGLIKWNGYTKKMSNRKKKIEWPHNMVVYEICVTTVVTLDD